MDIDINTEHEGLRFTDGQYNDVGNLSKDAGNTIFDELSQDIESSTPYELGEGLDCLYYNGKKYEELQLSDLSGNVFSSMEEVKTFYTYYSMAVGFSVRIRKTDTCRNGAVRRFELCCSKEGMRKDPSQERLRDIVQRSEIERHVTKKKVKVTRCGCKARLLVKPCSGGFNAIRFDTEHNHELVPSSMIHMLPSNRCVPPQASAHVSTLRKLGIPTTRLMVHCAGGYEYVGFTIKDLHNQIDCERRDILVDGDAQAAIAFMDLKATRDPCFYCNFSVDGEGRLANMFWRDSRCLADYNKFGEVLIMDSTYKTNVYGKPLVVFVGVNNHRATVLFACALIVDETEETYKWVVSSFLSSMEGKKPVSVITDQDEAMRKAVVSLIPEARHRLCAWHISKNVASNIHVKDVQQHFFHLTYAGLSVQEWENYWNYHIVAMNGLQDNPWVIAMYNKRDRWAEAFFRDDFFGGVCTTQRCEGMHRIFKIKHLHKFMRMFELLPRLDRSMEGIRERQLFDDFTSINSSPVIGDNMRKMQKHISQIFTHDIFLLLQDQINFEARFIIEERDDSGDGCSVRYVLAQYTKPERKWHVIYRDNQGKPIYACTCKLFESDGIPCCHIFSVLKSRHIFELPESLVTARWTKSAMHDNIPNPHGSGQIPDKGLRRARYGDLTAQFANICFKASFSNEAYDEVLTCVRRMSIRAESYQVVLDNDDEAAADLVDGLHPNVIKDPNICTSKGTRTKASKACDHTVGNKNGTGTVQCSICKGWGRNKRSCPTKQSDGPNKSQRGKAATVRAGEPNGEHEDLDSDTEEQIGVTGSNQNTLLHHRYEGRTFDFFGGYDTYPPSASTSIPADSWRFGP